MRHAAEFGVRALGWACLVVTLALLPRTSRAEEAPPRPSFYVGAGAGTWMLGVAASVRAGYHATDSIALEVGVLAGTSAVPDLWPYATMQADASVVVSPGGATTLRAGLVVERLGNDAFDTDDGETTVPASTTTRVGPVFAIGSRWEWTHVMLSIEWVGLSLTAPLRTPPGSSDGSRSGSSGDDAGVEPRFLNVFVAFE